MQNYKLCWRILHGLLAKCGNNQKTQPMHSAQPSAQLENPKICWSRCARRLKKLLLRITA